MQLVEKYQPKDIAGFVGIDIPRRILGAFAARPYRTAFFLLGPSGVGKTALALATTAAIGAELHHVPSQEGSIENLERVIHCCWMAPMFSTGGWHSVLVDEVDKISKAAQLYLLSKMDATGWPPETTYFFTSNDATGMEDRFLSRCKVINFDAEALLTPGVGLLRKIWRRETRDIRRKPEAPDFAAILRHTHCNIRESLQHLETELLCPGAFATLAPSVVGAAATKETSVYTVGLAKLSRDTLQEILETFKIKTVIDVRPKPKGGGFPRTRLEEELGERYRWLGDVLGERPKDNGYRELLAAPKPSLITCVESMPGSCHRHHKIANTLYTRGVEVSHIFENELIRSADLEQAIRRRQDEYACTEWKQA